MKSKRIPQSGNLIILFFTIVVVMIGFGIVFPILPFYLESFGGGGREMGFVISIYALLQFVFSPFFGTISERYGRKPLLVIGVFGTAVSHFMFAVAQSLWVVYLARALAGILSAVTLPTGMAYVSDSTTEEKRGSAMGYLSGGMGVGVVLGPGLGGLLGSSSVTLPFYIAAGLSLIAFILIVVFLPESLPKEIRLNGKRGRAPQIREMYEALTSPIGILLFVAFLLSFSLTNLETVFGLFSLARYGFGAGEVGVVLMIAGVIYAVIPTVFMGPLTKRFGDLSVMRGALWANAIGFALMLLPVNMFGIILVAIVLVGGNALLRPATTSLISKSTNTGQGLAMGLINSFNSLGRIVGPILAGYFFDIDINLPFISGAVILFVGYLVTLFGLKSNKANATSKGEILLPLSNSKYHSE
jgi:DHA1 family multidrug resistance protein-like MFS transporter